MGDFQEFYGLDLDDIWSGRLRVRRALELSEQLTVRANSRYRAALLGGPQFIGWGTDRELAANTRDLILALAMGLAGKAVSPDAWWPLPSASSPKDADGSDGVGTLADFDIDAFMRGDW